MSIQSRKWKKSSLKVCPIQTFNAGVYQPTTSLTQKNNYFSAEYAVR